MPAELKPTESKSSLGLIAYVLLLVCVLMMMFGGKGARKEVNTISPQPPVKPELSKSVTSRQAKPAVTPAPAASVIYPTPIPEGAREPEVGDRDGPPGPQLNLP